MEGGGGGAQQELRSFPDWLGQDLLRAEEEAEDAVDLLSGEDEAFDVEGKAEEEEEKEEEVKECLVVHATHQVSKEIMELRKIHPLICILGLAELAFPSCRRPPACANNGLGKPPTIQGPCATQYHNARKTQRCTVQPETLCSSDMP